MKKLMLPFVIMLFFLLAACNGNDNNADASAKQDEETSEETSKEIKSDAQENSDSEVSSFVKEYNELASLTDDLESLIDTNEIDDSGAQVLYASSNYGIIAIYEKDALEKYSFVFSKDEPYEVLKGTALNALLHVAATLNIEHDELIKEFEESLSKEFYSYFTEKHVIVFFNHELSGQSDFGMVVEFVKK